jgi:hypothetical protein
MKKLLLLWIFSGSIDCFSQTEKLYLWPDGKLSVLNPGAGLPLLPDTLRATLIVYYDNGPAILHTKSGFVVRRSRDEVYLDDKMKVIKAPWEVYGYKLKNNKNKN